MSSPPFVLGALSSGMMLYGASLLYGFSGTVSFEGIAAVVSHSAPIGVIFGLVFVLAGLAFKMSAAPFHMWTPDVYEGAPTPVTAFFASSAIGQTNIKRLMAYSSIGHMGFVLIGLAAGTEDAIRGVAIYLVIYAIMTLGAFAAILTMRVDGKPVENISDLAGLSRSNGATAFFFSMLMFSLAGVPPLGGFFAKYYVLLPAVQAGLYPLAVLGVLASAVAAYYYLRIVKVMYFDEPAPHFDHSAFTPRAVLAVSSIFLLCFWVYPAPLMNAATAAAKSLF